jgi:hypothetical protein
MERLAVVSCSAVVELAAGMSERVLPEPAVRQVPLVVAAVVEAEVQPGSRMELGFAGVAVQTRV